MARVRVEQALTRNHAAASAISRCSRKYWLALPLLGVLHAWSVAWPWGGQALWWLQLAAMGGLVWILGRHALWLAPEGAGMDSRAIATDFTPPLRRRFWYGFTVGWLFAASWLAGVFWWLYVSMHVYGGLPAWLSVLAVALLAGAVALFYAVVCGLFVHWGAGRSWQVQVTLFAALWLLAELCRGEWFTGFPWGAVGYAHVDGPLAVGARLIGVYGIGLLAAASSAVLGLLPAMARQQRWRWLGGLLALWIAAAALQPLAGDPSANDGKPSGAPISVALLQGNIAQNEKFQPNGGVVQALQWYGEQLMASQADLVVIPETALPMLPQNLPAGYWQALQDRFANGNQAALLGVPAGNRTIGYANAVVGMAPGGAQAVGAGLQPDLALPPAPQPEYRYAKHHLVPFGEFIPSGFRWFVDMMQIPLGDFQRGTPRQPRLLWRGQRIQPNICYEDLFGEELAASFTDAATAPTILVNMSNIAWFGDTVAIDQHRHISRMRALELDRPMLRATNTGATAIIAADGRVLEELPRLTRGVLTGTVQGRDGITPYAWWAGRFSLWPLWIFGILTVVVLRLLCKPAPNRSQ